jgi:hypothetical protein
LKSLWLEEIIINDFSVIKSSLMSPKSSLKGPKKPLWAQAIMLDPNFYQDAWARAW